MSNFPSLGDLGLTHDPAGRGYHAVYREHEVNHCPGCGRTHWIIGRAAIPEPGAAQLPPTGNGSWPG